jgi:hypothetical protein
MIKSGTGRVCGASQRSLFRIPLLADGFGCREYARIDRAGFPNQPDPFELGLRNESYDFTQLALLPQGIGSLSFPLNDDELNQVLMWVLLPL